MIRAAALALLLSCARPPHDARLVFKQQPLWGEPAPFEGVLREFARANPDVDVVVAQVPNASDLLHQVYLPALEGGADDFDVMVVDTIWVPEFARAGWAADLSAWFPPAQVRDAIERFLK